MSHQNTDLIKTWQERQKATGIGSVEAKDDEIRDLRQAMQALQAENKRILEIGFTWDVAKVRALMTRCDELQARLAELEGQEVVATFDVAVNERTAAINYNFTKGKLKSGDKLYLAAGAQPAAEPDYEALEREHLGDSDKKTGIYAKPVSTSVPNLTKAFEGMGAGRKANKHRFWGAGEPDCPPELKAPNGEIHTLRCRVCGDDWRASQGVCQQPASAAVPEDIQRAKLIADKARPFVNDATYIGHRVYLNDLAWALQILAAAPPPPGAKPLPLTGLSQSQEPKYTTDGTAILNRASGEAIPSDEPIFIFRARDKSSLVGLLAYLEAIKNREPTGPHAEAVTKRIEDFTRFAVDHPERMKWPDTTVNHITGEPT